MKLTIKEIAKLARETKSRPVEIKSSEDSYKYDRIAIAINKTKKVMKMMDRL